MRFIRDGKQCRSVFREQPCRRDVDGAAGIPFNLLSPKVLVISRACSAPFTSFSTSWATLLHCVSSDVPTDGGI